MANTSSGIVHITGSTRSEFTIWVSEKTAKYFSVESNNSNGTQWLISEVKASKVSRLMALKLHAERGLTWAIVDKNLSDPKKTTSVNVDRLLKGVESAAFKNLPNEKRPENRGSILLAVAIAATENARYSESGLHINGTSEREDLTSDDWVNAYKHVELIESLPDYLRLEFVTTMKELHVDCKSLLEVEQTAIAPVEEVQPVAEVEEQPAIAEPVTSVTLPSKGKSKKTETQPVMVAA